MNGTALSRRATLLFAALGVASLLTGFVAAIFAEPSPTVRSAEPDSFSRSAVGHRAFVEVLRRTGHRVLVSRSRSAARAAESGVLLLLEPPTDAEALAAILEGVDRALVVLPKWIGSEDSHDQPSGATHRDGWITGSSLLDPGEPNDLLAALDLDAVVVRSSGPFVATSGVRSRVVALDGPQLIDSVDIEPLIESDAGVLIASTELSHCGELWLLSDPGLIQNHGIAKGDNAAIVTTLIDLVARPGELIVVDETLHGHEVAPHVWGALGRFPLVLALGHGALVVAFLIWVASRRLGSPLPDPPALRPGRMTLVDSTAELLLHGGHSPSILKRYLRNEERRVAAARGVPRGLDDDDRRAALAEVETRRRPSIRLEDVVAAVARVDVDEKSKGARLLHAARTIHRWRTEMLHGTH